MIFTLGLQLEIVLSNFDFSQLNFSISLFLDMDFFTLRLGLNFLQAPGRDQIRARWTNHLLSLLFTLENIKIID